MAFVQRVSRTLASPRGVLIAVGLGVLLTLPSLRVGWYADDYFHQLVLTRQSLFPDSHRSVGELFRFIDGDPAKTHRLMDIGFLPWWAWPHLRAGFWRPVTAATHWIDYQLWPNWPVMMHLQNLMWYGLLIAAAAVLYRRIMGPVWVAGLAVILYAMDDAHGLPVGWIANRNAVVAAFFGVAALIAHDRWRRGSSAWAGLLAALLLCLSVLSAEAGIATCAYLFAYAFFIEEGSWKHRALSLVPYVVIIVIWRVVWTMQGYGVYGMGLYTDPLAQLGQFVRELPQKVPLLLLGQWALPPADFTILMSEHTVAVLRWIAVAVVVGLALMLAPVVRQSRPARFWACGMLLSLLPISATFPSDRLLFFVGIGAMGLLALLFDWVFVRRGEGLSPGLAKALRVPAVLLAIIHLVIAPPALAVRSGLPAGPTKVVQALEVRTPLDERVTNQSLIIINAPSAMHAHYVPIIQHLRHQPVPKHTRVLAPAVPAVAVQRLDEKSLLVRPEYGFYTFLLDQLFRTPEHPFQVGDCVELTDMTVEITALTPDNRAAEAIFRFKVPLEDPSLRWLKYVHGEFVPFIPPAQGETVVLTADLPWKEPA